MHGDHYFGLIGLISTFRLLTRTTDLHIYGPKGLEDVIKLQMTLAHSWTNFRLIFHELTSKNSELIYEDEKVEVHTIPLDHRIYTNGFLFKEKPGYRKLDMKAIQKAEIDVAYFRKLQQGSDVVSKTGKLVRNETVTNDPTPPKSYAFCSDTAYKEELAEQIEGCDVLYHESTFLEQHKALAAPTKHSTARQAAAIAKKAKVKTLILGHYSTRYRNIDLFKEEAEELFENVELAKEGKIFKF